jgi:hypothetical protein
MCRPTARDPAGSSQCCGTGRLLSRSDFSKRSDPDTVQYKSCINIFTPWNFFRTKITSKLYAWSESDQKDPDLNPLVQALYTKSKMNRNPPPPFLVCSMHCTVNSWYPQGSFIALSLSMLAQLEKGQANSVILVQSKYTRTFPCIFTWTLVLVNIHGKVLRYLLWTRITSALFYQWCKTANRRRKVLQTMEINAEQFGSMHSNA